MLCVDVAPHRGLLYDAFVVNYEDVVPTDREAPTQDERLMAALGHGAIILPIWGLMLAALIWVTQREKSAYVRRQGAQALAWHVLQVAVTLVGFACYTLSIFGTVFLGVTGAVAGDGEVPFFPLFPIIPFLTMGLIFLIMLAFIMVGVVAAVQTLQGHDFRYPLLGPRVDAFLDA